MNWKYTQPVEIEFGNGKIKNLKTLIKDRGYKNGLLVSSKFLVKNNTASNIIEECEGLIIDIFSNIQPNPTIENVDECAELIKDKNIEFIVALGGGSVIDCAKASATICLTNDSIAKYHGTGIEVPKEHIPLFAIPTTSGTGSEVTCVSVITDEKLGKKAPIASNGFYPEVAIIDPELTYTVPSNITASTGIDVLSHALEGFWSKNHQPICDALALHACELVFEYLPRACENPKDLIAREKMSEASLIAGLAFSIPKTTSSHACSFPLTNIYNIPHGEACGLTLDYFTRINGKNDNGRLDKFATKLGFNDSFHMADAIYELKKKIGLLRDLKYLNLLDDQIDELVKKSNHPNLYNNPVEITDDMLLEMYISLR